MQGRVGIWPACLAPLLVASSFPQRARAGPVCKAARPSGSWHRLCTVRTSSFCPAQAQRDAALWLLACVLALWTPREPEHAWQPGFALPHEDADAHLPRVDDLAPLYGMMRQVRAMVPLLLSVYVVTRFMQPGDAGVWGFQAGSMRMQPGGAVAGVRPRA